MSKLAKSLGMERPSGPLPPKFQPKVQIRVTCGRTKQVVEFAVDIPIDGTSETAFEKCSEKLSDIFRRLGILAEKPLTAEQENAQRNLPADEEKDENQAGACDGESRDEEKARAG